MNWIREGIQEGLPFLFSTFTSPSVLATPLLSEYLGLRRSGIFQGFDDRNSLVSYLFLPETRCRLQFSPGR